ncbi:uncharacterized protein LOC142169644 [Nicotiana tabacum]|uniref:Uncharacterized protein LOC142169644 n=1 Tax=Nicotiana tabacum TaxID=4097 RepID=A0AC58SRN4_TOBAC
MKIKILSWNMWGLNDGEKRRLIKTVLNEWRCDVVVLQETKIEGDISRVARHLWGSRWVDFVNLEAIGTSGGILIMWDKRLLEGELIISGSQSISCRLTAIGQDFSWFITGIYASNSRIERQDLWWELAASRGLCNGPWVVCRDFNTTRHSNERSNNHRLTRAMRNFSDAINDLPLVDPPLFGGSFTWNKGNNQGIASRIDRFLFSIEWDEHFRNIRQSTLPRITSDHCPIKLTCGDWEQRKPSYFKFANWWLEVDGFKDLVKAWWLSFAVQGHPDFILATKLKLLKAKLKEWNVANFGDLAKRKTELLNQLTILDVLQEQRNLTDDELIQKANIALDFEEISKYEESSWRQKSRILWLKQGDK